MTIPGIGALPLSGFQRPDMLLFGLVPLALFAIYLVVRVRRRERLRRFTESNLPQAFWQHIPIAMSFVCLVLLTVSLATPSHAVQIPRNRAIIMLVIDVSQSMRATDVPPNRLTAAEQAAGHFVNQLTQGINLGLVAFAETPYLLVPPAQDHQATLAALQKLQFADSTATGEAIFTALHAITAGNVAGESSPPPARVVLLSDGGENKPADPNDPHGAYTAARLAKDHGVPISTISFGTKAGSIELNGQRVSVPVEGDQMTTIARLSGGQTYSATNVGELDRSYKAIKEEIGYRTVTGPASTGWLRLAVIVATIATGLALLINRRLPT